MPFFRSLRTPSMQVSARPYLTQRSHGRASSQRLHALAQFVHCEIMSTLSANSALSERKKQGEVSCLAMKDMREYTCLSYARRRDIDNCRRDDNHLNHGATCTETLSVA